MPPSVRVSPRRRRVFVAVALLLGLFGGFLGAELLLRMLGPAWLRHRMKELAAAGMERSHEGTDLEWSYEVANGRFLRFSPGTSFRIRHAEYDHRVTIDALGGRTVVGPPAVSGLERLPAIPFLGDSFVFGIGVPDGSTFVSLLSQRISRPMLNLGVPGSCLTQQLDILERRHRELGAPDLVFFGFFLGNDFSELMGTLPADETENGGSSRGLTASKVPARILARLNEFASRNAVLRRSYSLQLVRREVLRAFNSSRERPLVYPLFALLRREERYDRKARAALRIALDRLQALAGTLDFQPAFLVIPDIYQLDRVRCETRAASYGLDAARLDPAFPNRLFKDELTQRRLPFFDVTPCLGDPRELYYEIDNHLTPAGHRVVSECAADWVQSIVTACAHRTSIP